MKDSLGKWLEANIIEIIPTEMSIKIHYKGWASKFDEYLPVFDPSQKLLDTKYAEIGRYSAAYGRARFEKAHSQQLAGGHET